MGGGKKVTREFETHFLKDPEFGLLLSTNINRQKVKTKVHNWWKHHAKKGSKTETNDVFPINFKHDMQV